MDLGTLCAGISQRLGSDVKDKMPEDNQDLIKVLEEEAAQAAQAHYTALCQAYHDAIPVWLQSPLATIRPLAFTVDTVANFIYLNAPEGYAKLAAVFEYQKESWRLTRYWCELYSPPFQIERVPCQSLGAALLTAREMVERELRQATNALKALDSVDTSATQSIQ